MWWRQRCRRMRKKREPLHMLVDKSSVYPEKCRYIHYRVKLFVMHTLNSWNCYGMIPNVRAHTHTNKSNVLSDCLRFIWFGCKFNGTSLQFLFFSVHGLQIKRIIAWIVYNSIIKLDDYVKVWLSFCSTMHFNWSKLLI